ncbi:MAG: hypothetical protein JXA55_09005, partial [Bacteroidales bacterium]|nr:hypothetical protein [Bacteroidales bacterium]
RLSFDQLCASPGEIFIRFFEYYKQGFDSRLKMIIRDRKDSGARFTTSRSNDYISNVVIWTGEGRNRSERKINLSIPQGRFLFHLPFPTAEALSIAEILKRAGIERANIPEIIDIVNVLIDYRVIEKDNKSID